MATAAAAAVARKSLRCCAWRTISPSILRNESPSILSRSSWHSSVSSRLRRESFFLKSLFPIHTATASARLVSMLPSELNVSIQELQKSQLNESAHDSRMG